jgi:hypothetical protein
VEDALSGQGVPASASSTKAATTSEEHAAIIDREETKWLTVIHGNGITLRE